MDPLFASSAVARRLVTRIMRADVEAAASWAPGAAQCVGCPVVVAAGVEDPVVSAAALCGWRGAAVGGFRCVALPGGHFFRGGLGDLVPVVRDAWPAGAGVPGCVPGGKGSPQQHEERNAHV
jgi:surfactin synthase thioesterase subunit